MLKGVGICNKRVGIGLERKLKDFKFDLEVDWKPVQMLDNLSNQ